MRAKLKAPACSAPESGVEDQELLWMWLHAKSDRTRAVYREEALKFLAWINSHLRIDYMGATELQYIDDDDGEYNDNDDDEQ